VNGGAIIARTTRTTFKTSGQTEDFIAFADVPWNNVGGYKDVFTNQAKLMLQTGFMGSNDWPKLIGCLDNYEFLSYLKPLSHDRILRCW